MRRLVLALMLPLAACGDAASAPSDPAAQALPPRFTQLSADPAKHGERIAKVLGCTGCHDDNLTGRDWSEPGYGTLWTANLTRSAERWSDAELTQMIIAGKRPDRALMEMPSELFARLHPDDVAAMVAYLKSLDPVGPVHPDATIGPLLAKEIAAGDYRNSAQQVADHAGEAPPDLGPDHALGRQIISVTCAECHGSDLRGKPAPTPDAAARPDLRMVAAYSRPDFAVLMQTGKAVGGRELELMSGVARRRYAGFTDAEEQAIYAYLVELALRDPVR
jgi:mono/diheme cytochrome c family protein